MNNLRLQAQQNKQPELQWGDIILVNDPNWYDALIRWRILSDFNHVAIFTGDGHVTDARGSGVLKRSLELFANKKVMILRLPDKSIYEVGKHFLENQLGKPYDWFALWGFTIDKDEATYGLRWFCFELVRAFLELKYKFERYDQPKGLTRPEYFIMNPNLTILYEGIFKLPG